LKGNTVMQKSITIYMKKDLTNPTLKTEEELLKEWNNNSNNRKKKGKGN